MTQVLAFAQIARDIGIAFIAAVIVMAVYRSNP